MTASSSSRQFGRGAPTAATKAHRLEPAPHQDRFAGVRERTYDIGTARGFFGRSDGASPNLGGTGSGVLGCGAPHPDVAQCANPGQEARVCAGKDSAAKQPKRALSFLGEAIRSNCADSRCTACREHIALQDCERSSVDGAEEHNDREQSR